MMVPRGLRRNGKSIGRRMGLPTTLGDCSRFTARLLGAHLKTLIDFPPAQGGNTFGAPSTIKAEIAKEEQ
jgi:hypothetical protein